MIKIFHDKILDFKIDTRTVYACNSNEIITDKQIGGTCVTLIKKYGQYSKEMETNKTEPRKNQQRQKPLKKNNKSKNIHEN